MKHSSNGLPPGLPPDAAMGGTMPMMLAQPIQDPQVVALLAGQLLAAHPGWSAADCVAKAIEILAHTIAAYRTGDPLKAEAEALKDPRYGMIDPRDAEEQDPDAPKPRTPRLPFTLESP